MKIKNIDHLVIAARDIEKSLRFYVNILGMELENVNNFYAVKFGNQKINLHHAGAQYAPVARNVTFGSADICLIAEGVIEQIKTELEAKGIDIEMGIVQRRGANGPIDSVYVRDPDENLVEISVYR